MGPTNLGRWPPSFWGPSPCEYFNFIYFIWDAMARLLKTSGLASGKTRRQHLSTCPPPLWAPTCRVDQVLTATPPWWWWMAQHPPPCLWATAHRVGHRCRSNGEGMRREENRRWQPPCMHVPAILLYSKAAFFVHLAPALYDKISVKYWVWVKSSNGVLRDFQGVDRKGLASACKKLCPSHLLLP